MGTKQNNKNSQFRELTDEELEKVNGGGGVYDSGAGNVCVGLANICRANGGIEYSCPSGTECAVETMDVCCRM